MQSPMRNRLQVSPDRDGKVQSMAVVSPNDKRRKSMADSEDRNRFFGYWKQQKSVVE